MRRHEIDTSAIGKPVKTLFGWLIFRRISKPLSIALARLGVTPYLITAAGVAAGISAALVYSRGTRSWMLAGAGLAVLAKVMDACDGEVARMRHIETPRGYVLDGLADRFRDAFLLLGVAGAARFEPYGPAWAMAALVAYLGFFYVSAASPAHWREAQGEEDVRDKHAFRVTRQLRLGAGDTLIVAIAAAAAIDRPLWLLMAIAVTGPWFIVFKILRLMRLRSGGLGVTG